MFVFHRIFHNLISCNHRFLEDAKQQSLQRNPTEIPNHSCHCPMKQNIFLLHHASDYRRDCNNNPGNKIKFEEMKLWYTHELVRLLCYLLVPFDRNSLMLRLVELFPNGPNDQTLALVSYLLSIVRFEFAFQ